MHTIASKQLDCRNQLRAGGEEDSTKPPNQVRIIQLCRFIRFRHAPHSSESIKLFSESSESCRRPVHPSCCAARISPGNEGLTVRLTESSHSRRCDGISRRPNQQVMFRFLESGLLRWFSNWIVGVGSSNHLSSLTTELAWPSRTEFNSSGDGRGT